MKICPNCQLECEDKFAFCHHCGSKLEEKIEQFFCPYCGNRIETDGEFCPYCGNSLDETSSPISGDIAKPPVTIQKQKDSKENILPEVNFKKEYVKMAPLQRSDDNIANNDNNSQTDQEESKPKVIIKGILTIIGGLFLWFFIKVLGKGMARAARSGGYLIEFIVICIVVILLGYYFTRKNE